MFIALNDSYFSEYPREIYYSAIEKKMIISNAKITSSSRRRFDSRPRLQECGDQTREVRTRRVRDVSTNEKTTPSRIRIISKSRVYAT